MTSSINDLPSTNAGSSIPQSVAQQLINTYKTEEGWASDKTRAVWFALSDLTAIEDLIEDAEGDGVRIYFGKYPSDVDIPGTPDPAYKGRVTLVFIPTLAGPDDSHPDLFPPLPQDNEVEEDDQAYNHGNLCPPNCPPPPPPIQP